MKIQIVSMPVQDPVAAHEIYVSKPGFVSREFDAEAMFAIVAAPEEQDDSTL